MAMINVPISQSHAWDANSPRSPDTTPAVTSETKPAQSRQAVKRWVNVLKVILIIAAIAIAVIAATKVVKIVSALIKYPTAPLIGPPRGIPKGKPPLSAAGYAIYPTLVKETEYTAVPHGLQVQSLVKPSLPNVPLAVKVGLTIATFGLGLLLGGPAGKVLTKAVDLTTGGL